MVLIGIHPAVDHEKEVCFLKSAEAISTTPTGSLVVLDFNESDLALYATCEVPLGGIVHNIREFVLLMNTRVRYAIASLELAAELQKLADHYLSDVKVLAHTKASALDTVALAGIDGILVKA